MSDRGPCPRCRYIGPRHLCGCMAALGEAIKNGTREDALLHFERITAAANEDIRRRRLV